VIFVYYGNGCYLLRIPVPPMTRGENLWVSRYGYLRVWVQVKSHVPGGYPCQCLGIAEACMSHGLLPSGMIESPRKGHHLAFASMCHCYSQCPSGNQSYSPLDLSTYQQSGQHCEQNTQFIPRWWPSLTHPLQWSWVCHGDQKFSQNL
jgi:hypothetical protein